MADLKSCIVCHDGALTYQSVCEHCTNRFGADSVLFMFVIQNLVEAGHTVTLDINTIKVSERGSQAPLWEGSDLMDVWKKVFGNEQ